MFWYEDEIKRLEKRRKGLTSQPETLFYGSSSIRLWSSLDKDFAEYSPINLGFGGSTLAACTWFFNRVMVDYSPARIILYAGDNDLGDGRHPEEVFLFFQQFAVRVSDRFGSLPCYFISLKPSVARAQLLKQFYFTNQLIAGEIKKLANWHWIDVYNAMLTADGKPDPSYFLEDGLHLNPTGYELWAKIIKSALSG